jgi:hypothetical protein
MQQNKKYKSADIENIKAKLQSAKEELQKRFGEAVEKIKEDIDQQKDVARDTWSKHSSDSN